MNYIYLRCLQNEVFKHKNSISKRTQDLLKLLKFMIRNITTYSVSSQKNISRRLHVSAVNRKSLHDRHARLMLSIFELQGLIPDSLRTQCVKCFV